MQQRQQSRLVLELTLLCSVLHHVLGQVSMSSVGGLLSKLAVLRDTPQLLHRTALLVEHQVAPEGNTLLLLSSAAIALPSDSAFALRACMRFHTAR
jgi:hypothetical protein